MTKKSFSFNFLKRSVWDANIRHWFEAWPGASVGYFGLRFDVDLAQLLKSLCGKFANVGKDLSRQNEQAW